MRLGRLYLITKLQNLKAIHNCDLLTELADVLYLITKLQNLKAIHNEDLTTLFGQSVVSNYKITKSESYSQLCDAFPLVCAGCI